MKKKYEKPQVLIEDYKMSEICASSPCEEKVSYSDGDTCKSIGSFDGFDDEWNPIKIYLFNSENSDCTAGWDDSLGVANGLCYHGPDDNNLFTS